MQRRRSATILERRPTRARRRKARRRRAGGVLIEALVVIGVLAVCFVGFVCAHEVFGGKLETVYTARQRAWQETMAGCDQFPIDIMAIAERAVLRDQHVIQALARGEIDLHTWFEDTMALLVEVLGGEDVRIASEQTDVRPPAALEEVPRTAVTSTLMGCNEEPHDLGTRTSLYEWITGLFF